MKKAHHIFLTVPEILESIRLDFKQYPTQTELFRELALRLLPDKVMVVTHGPQKGVWSRTGQRGIPRRIRGDTLEGLILETLANTSLPLDRLSEICRRIFWVKTWKGTDPSTGEPGIWLDTEMDQFSCRQCGQCCRTLHYHDECGQEDVDRWEAAGRRDILDWVQKVDQGKGRTRYRIWVDPGTRRLAPVCPWLSPTPDRQRHLCSIHAVKPFICRQYPGSRKHAVMTGCQGNSLAKAGQAVTVP